MSRKNKKQRNRTGNMECPICKEKHILVEHHINGRNIPNYNQKSNLVDLCSNCHRKVHEGIIIIEGWLMTTAGMELFWHKKGEDNVTGRNSNTYIIGHSSQ